MKITEARKKFKICKSLLWEYNILQATIRAIDKTNKETKIEPIESPNGLISYYENMRKRLIKIEMEFDTLLK